MKEAIPDAVLELMATKFWLLGNATRLAIIRSLMMDGEQNVGELVAQTHRTHANLSKHLKHLHRVGMLSRRKEGLQVFYSLSDPVIEKICKLVCDSVLPYVKKQMK